MIKLILYLNDGSVVESPELKNTNDRLRMRLIAHTTGKTMVRNGLILKYEVL